jgi:tetratricopeptide (TPR) repeat protein
VETVAWVTHEQFTLASFFALLAVLFYLRVDRVTGVWYWITVLMVSAAALAHPIVMPLPAILLIMDFYPLRRRGELHPPGKRLAVLSLEKIPMLIAPVLVGAMTMLGRMSPQSGIWKPPPTLAEFDLAHRVAQAVYVWAYYLWRPLVPVNLSPVYTTLLDFKPWEPRFIVSAVLLVSLGALSLALRRRAPGLLALFVCHLLILIPVTGFAEHPHWTSDRYSYVQGMIFAVATGWLIAYALLHRRQIQKFICIICVALIICSAVMSHRLAFIWRDSVSLFQHILAKLDGHPYSGDIHWRLGEVYLDQGRYNEAAQRASASLRGDPNLFQALIVKGVAEIELRHSPDAIAPLRRAVSIDPTDPAARRLLGIALASGNHLDDAEAQLRRSVELSPSVVETHYWLGEVLLQKRDTDGARQEFSEALRLSAGYERARQRLAQLDARK